MAKSKFYELIKNSHIEKDIENVYTQGINLYFPEATIEHPFACDAFVSTKTRNNKLLNLVIEYKFDEDFKSKVTRAKVISQVLFYLKRFEQNGYILPNIVMVGDLNECFVFHSNDIISYLDEDIDWSTAPSCAYINNPDLVMKIAEDENINPFIFDINEHFSFKEVVEKIYDLADNIQRYVHVTEHNIATIFEYFNKNVIVNKKKISANDLVAIFIGVITKNENYYVHPTKKGTLLSPFGEIKIDNRGFNSFFSYFNRNYTPQEKMRFSEISDRLIEDTNRRNKGEYYTPVLFVDYAHNMIAKQFGEDWKEKYVVWDNCFDGETEYLSENGWKKISEYNGGKVMQYKKDGSTEFVTPLRYINQEYNGEMLHYVSSQMDILCTPDHNFVVKKDNKDRNQELFKISANELLDRYNKVKNTHLIVPKTFIYDGKLEIDENILRLAIAINADGTYVPKTTLSNNKGRTKRNTRFTANDTSVRDCFCVMVTKERKKERMRMLLSNAKIEWKEKEYGTYTHFTFHFPYFNPKQFPNEWYNLSSKCKEVIMEEILLWDGSLTETKFGIRKTYSTSKKNDADFIAFVGASCGYGVNMREDKRGERTNYLLSFTRIKNTKISTKSTFTKEVNTHGRVYCFEVESGMLVVRRNNKIYVSSNCAGTKNLTRDYYFKELYCSTLEKAELDISAHYNKEATSFQFDFLNDSLDNLPKGLLKAFEENKPIIFFMNPPYATAGVQSSDSKKGVAKTMINEQMLKDKVGASAQNLYAQFIYRIMMIKRKYNLTNCHIAMFTPTLYLSGSSWKGFRKEFFKDFAYTDGCTFRASHFADVADNWGIAFSIWNNGKNCEAGCFNHKLIDCVNGEDGITKIGEKVIYNLDVNESASNWCKEPIKTLKAYEQINLKSALTIRDKNSRGRIFDNNLGYFYNDSNNIDKNTQSVSLLSAAFGNGNGHGLSTDNFTRCTSLFAARKLVEKTWVNSKDEYLAPNTEHENWQEFVNDSIVYSLFHSASNQSSLRQIEYKGKKWDIKNEFFWMSKNEMMALANENGNDHCYNDARVSSERYVYTLLQGITLSEEAKAVLDKACELVRKTFKYRMMFDEDNENYQINNWDASYYQLKALWKEYAKDDFEEFKELYKKLSDKMLPMVYELGFLKK